MLRSVLDERFQTRQRLIPLFTDETEVFADFRNRFQVCSSRKPAPRLQRDCIGADQVAQLPSSRDCGCIAGYEIYRAG